MGRNITGAALGKGLIELVNQSRCGSGGSRPGYVGRLRVTNTTMEVTDQDRIGKEENPNTRQCKQTNPHNLVENRLSRVGQTTVPVPHRTQNGDRNQR